MTGRRTTTTRGQVHHRSIAAAAVDAPAEVASVVTGLAVPYDTPTQITPTVVEVITPGAFAASLSDKLPLLVEHNRTQIAGVASRWDERRDGLHGTWRFDTGEVAQEAARKVRGGLLNFLSIGFQLHDVEWTMLRDGRELATVHRARLLEVSLVAVPAYAEAAVTSVRSSDEDASLTSLAIETCAPLLCEAITGSDVQVRAAVGLVRKFVEQHGGGAVPRLEDLAAAPTTPPHLAVNLARAAMALDGADPADLRRVNLAYWRRGLPARPSVPRRPRR